MSRKLTTGQIRQLVEIDANGEGIADEVQELIRRLTSGGVADKSGDPRAVQAKRYWDLGVGRELGKASFDDYLADIPEIPKALIADDPNFPHLVLVEPRIGLAKLCQFGNVVFNGDDQTFVPFDEHYADGSQPFWIRAQDGRKNRNRRPSDCRKSFAENEFGLTATQGVCAYLQTPEVVTDMKKGSDGHVMDLTGSVHRGGRAFCAYLLVRGGRARLYWRWYGYAFPLCGSASRRECRAL